MRLPVGVKTPTSCAAAARQPASRSVMAQRPGPGKDLCSIFIKSFSFAAKVRFHKCLVEILTNPGFNPLIIRLFPRGHRLHRAAGNPDDLWHTPLRMFLVLI